MEYGAKRYLRYQNYDVVQPNIIIDQDSTGDYLVKFNARTHEHSETSEAVVGDDEITAYLESALERFETDGDVQAGLIAAGIAYQFADRYGDMPPEVCEAITDALFATDTRVSQLLMTVALDSHPAVVQAIKQRLRARARSYTDLASITKDPLICEYVDVQSGGNAGIEAQAAAFLALLSVE